MCMCVCVLTAVSVSLVNFWLVKTSQELMFHITFFREHHKFPSFTAVKSYLHSISVELWDSTCQNCMSELNLRDVINIVSCCSTYFILAPTPKLDLLKSLKVDPECHKPNTLPLCLWDLFRYGGNNRPLSFSAQTSPWPNWLALLI